MGDLAKYKATILNQLYEDYNSPGGLGGIDRLWKAAKERDKSITKKDTIHFLSSKDSYTLHKTTRKRFARRKMVAGGPKIILSCDLADVRNLAKHNKSTNYLLICIDIFSRYLKVVPLKKKNAAVLLSALKNVLETPEFKNISRILTDRGSEFYNKLVAAYLREKKIKLYSISSYEIKAAIAERVIKTLKQKIYKFLTSRNTLTYLGALPGLVNNYNNSVHRTLGETPYHVHTLRDTNKIDRLFYKMYKNPKKTRDKITPSLAVGETVRLSDALRQSVFRKGYKIQNTLEIFRVKSIDRRQEPIVYILEDLNGEQIQGIFYREELTPSILPSVFPIDIIKKKKEKGRTKYLVSWRGYPSSFNAWVDSSELTKLR